MKLIGMLDSPYVRRVAVSLQLLGLPFEHRSLSVFRQFDEFSALNPVVKAPTLIADDGTVLMDSTLILDYRRAEASLRNRPNVSDSAEAIMQTEQAKRDSYAIELGIIQDMFEAGTINRTQMRQLRRNVYVMQVDAESEL